MTIILLRIADCVAGVGESATETFSVVECLLQMECFGEIACNG